MRKSFVTRAFALLLSVILTLSLYSESVSASSDPVYDSMTQPSESQSDYMIKAWRNYGKVIGNTSSPKSQRLLSMGALYTTTGKELPEKFTVYLGKIKLFAYSKSKKKWVCIDNQPYPRGIFVYELPWQKNKSHKCEKITYTSEGAKIELTSKEMKGNVLHFWGKTAPLNKEDYVHYACAFDFKVDAAAAGKLTATNGIDTKDSTGQYTISQLYSSRGLTCTTSFKTHWGHTVPKDDYNKYNTSSLNQLYASNLTELPDDPNPSDDFTIDKGNKGPKITKLTAGKKSIKVKWKKKSADTTGYEIQYSTNKRFKKNVTTEIVSTYNQNSLKIKKLKSHKMYYVRIRSYRKEGTKTIYSKWSKIKAIKTN
ncbi:MAG: fibronectin type III domain-containing protein [Butyrivibrio sp.]|nr:fibronectin type III domain-containing protein [Butyrivibrio sp.]